MEDCLRAHTGSSPLDDVADLELWDEHLRGLAMALAEFSDPAITAEEEDDLSVILNDNLLTSPLIKLTQRAIDRGEPGHWAAVYHLRWAHAMKLLFQAGYAPPLSMLPPYVRMLCSWNCLPTAVALIATLVRKRHIGGSSRIIDLTLSYVGAALQRHRNNNLTKGWTLLHDLALMLLSGGASPVRTPSGGHAFLYYIVCVNDIVAITLLHIFYPLSPETCLVSELHSYLTAPINEVCTSPDGRLALNFIKTLRWKSEWALAVECNIPLNVMKSFVHHGVLSPHSCIENHIRVCKAELRASFLPPIVCDGALFALKKARIYYLDKTITPSNCYKKRDSTLQQFLCTRIEVPDRWLVSIQAALPFAPYGAYAKKDYCAAMTFILCAKQKGYPPEMIAHICRFYGRKAADKNHAVIAL